MNNQGKQLRDMTMNQLKEIKHLIYNWIRQGTTINCSVVNRIKTLKKSSIK